MACTFLVASAGASFLGLAYSWGRGAVLQAPPLALIASLAASLALRSALQRMQQKFIYSDWRHSDH